MNVQIISKAVILGILFFSMTSSVFAESTSVVNCASVSRNLRLGMSGDDVKILQEVLNRSKETQLADVGPGSPGNETMYFGQITKAAVARFQEIYKSEVLTPVGLTSGSGYVGTFTRAKMVAFCAKSQVAATPASLIPVVPPVTPSPTQTTTTSTETSATVATPTTSLSGLSSFDSNVPVLMFPSSYTGPRGETMSISGVGFAASNNVVHLDDYVIASTTTTNASRVSFVIPKDVPLGNHSLWVSSTKGETNKTFFVVTNPNVLPPVVASSTPEKGFQGTMVTVTGSGFVSDKNTIHTSYGLIENIPSADGKTLQFSVSPPVPLLNPGEDRPGLDLNVPLWFYIVNGNGLSNSFVFHLTI